MFYGGDGLNFCLSGCVLRVVFCCIVLMPDGLCMRFVDDVSLLFGSWFFVLCSRLEIYPFVPQGFPVIPYPVCFLITI